MKELEFINIIQNTLSKSSHIGDDCAYLKDLGVVITHDSLVENIHFKTEFSSPYQIAYKAIMVNLSDVFASGACPKYLTISLSIPKSINGSFIKEFYQACEDLSKEYDFEIVGGDITGSEKIFISICAIGLTEKRRISSRMNAKAGDLIIATGVHGSSAAGLWLLSTEIDSSRSTFHSSLIKKHLQPTVQRDFSEEISTKISSDYAMMDSSDGLADALFKIASSSNVLLSVDFDKIPYSTEIEEIAKLANVDFRDWILYGGEDFELIACVSEEELQKINVDYAIIGRVKDKTENHFVEINFNDRIEKIKDLEKTFNHFKEN